jgi:tetratricopeptide (TPR) repeat protein
VENGNTEDTINGVLESFLRSLGVGPDNIPAERSARVARYRDLVRKRSMLVVLDNVGASDDAVPLIPTGPGSLAIVTSRHRLTKLTSHFGARAIVLGPIDQNASIALLSHLAGPWADGSAPLIADIARACAGHPLALCLAGARLATRPEEPLQAVAEALAEPGRRIRTLDEHAEANAAAKDVIGWSYRMLDEPTARVFRLLGLAPCPTLDLPSIARLADRGVDEVGPLVTRLAALHLVTAAAGRYGMLDLIAEYAGGLAAEIDGGEIEAALGRLYDHHGAAARAAAHAMWPLEVPAGPPGYDSADAATARTWLDYHREDLLTAARHRHARNRPRHIVDLANSLFRYLDHGGYLDQSVALQEEAVAAAGRLGDEPSRAWALGRLGAVLVRRGSADRAQSVLQQAHDLCARLGDSRGQAAALGNLGRLAFRRGAYGDAQVRQEAALELFRACGDRLAQARTLTNLGIVHNARGRYDEALAALATARATCDDLDARDAGARVTGTIAGILRAQGRLDEAESHYQASIDAFRALGDRVGEATSLSRLGLVRSDQGRHPEAVDLLETSMRTFTDAGDEGGCIETLLNLGTAMRVIGRHVAAVRSHREALDRAGRVGSEGQTARAHACLAEDYAAQATQVGAEAVDALALARKHCDEGMGRFQQLGVEPPRALVALSERLARV